MEHSITKRVQIGGLLLVITVAVGSMVWSLTRAKGTPPPVNRPRLEELGKMAAEKAVELAGPHKKIVVVGFAPEQRLAEHRIPFEAFRKTLQARGGVTLTVDLVDAHRLEAAARSESAAEVYRELLRKYATANCLVTFFGPPFGPVEQSIEQWQALPAQRPAWLAVEPDTQGQSALLRAKIMQWAIVRRIEALAGEESAPATSDSVEQWYTMVSAAEMAPHSSARRIE